ncbi:MAG: glycosyltransferase, partial [Campylobacterota bacterium]|nr:glycosyltransferase [Campylobacterota bacterium]
IVHNTQSKRRFKRHDSKKNTFLKTIKKKKVENSFYNKNLICVSNGVKNDLIDNFEIKPKSIDTIYNPFDVNDIQIMADINNPVIPNEDYIIHVGRFEIGHKRHDILLKAYKKSNIKEKLVLLGDGKDRSTIEDLIKELNLEDKVILAGFDSNPYPWIKNAKLFLFSSDYEGFGMVLVESLILNTPVVSTDCPSGPSEILTGELANYLVPVGDIDALASKMKNALEYYPQIKDEYINKFNSYTIIEQYINLINK